MNQCWIRRSGLDPKIHDWLDGDLHFPPSFIELLGLCSFQGPRATRPVDELEGSPLGWSLKTQQRDAHSGGPGARTIWSTFRIGRRQLPALECLVLIVEAP
jgi:hypothetical protein